MGNGSDLAREHVRARMKILGPSDWERLGKSLQTLSGPQSSQLIKGKLESSTKGQQAGVFESACLLKSGLPGFKSKFIHSLVY